MVESDGTGGRRRTNEEVNFHSHSNGGGTAHDAMRCEESADLQI